MVSEPDVGFGDKAEGHDPGSQREANGEIKKRGPGLGGDGAGTHGSTQSS